jgi:hypothetical protein
LCEKFNEQDGPSLPPDVVRQYALIGSLAKDSGIEPARLVAWAELAVKTEANCFTLHALTAAEYRAGTCEAVTRHAQQAIDHGAPRNLVAFLLALAYHRLGKPAESQLWYDIGRNEVEGVRPRNPSDPAPWAPYHWMYNPKSGR